MGFDWKIVSKNINRQNNKEWEYEGIILNKLPLLRRDEKNSKFEQKFYTVDEARGEKPLTTLTLRK